MIPCGTAIKKTEEADPGRIPVFFLGFLTVQMPGSRSMYTVSHRHKPEFSHESTILLSEREHSVKNEKVQS